MGAACVDDGGLLGRCGPLGLEPVTWCCLLSMSDTSAHDSGRRDKRLLRAQEDDPVDSGVVGKIGLVFNRQHGNRQFANSPNLEPVRNAGNVTALREPAGNVLMTRFAMVRPWAPVRRRLGDDRGVGTCVTARQPLSRPTHDNVRYVK